MIFVRIASAALCFSVLASAQLVTPTLVNSPDASSNQMVLSSASGITAGSELYIDREAMRVYAVSGVVATVYRGVDGTRVSNHAAGATVYGGPSSLFSSSDQSGTCTEPSTVPRIHVLTGVRWYCLGGSWSSQSANSGASLGSGTGPSVVILGDSITAFSSSTPSSFNMGGPLDTGYFTWANALLGQRLTLLNNAGVPGETTAQMLLRVQTDVVAYRPTYCIVMGGVNDVNASVPAATIWSNLKSIYSALTAAGIKVIATTTTASTIYDAPKAAIWADVNLRIKEYGKVTPNIIVVDTAKAYIDYASATAGPLSNYTSDGIHPTAKGAYAIGLLLYNALNPLIPAMDTLPVYEADPKNLLSNGMMSGTGGNLNSVSTGTIATSWIADKQGSPTCVMSKGTRSDGLGATQIITLSSGAGYASTCAIKQEASAAGYAVGDTVYVQGEVLAASTTVELDIEFWDSGFSFLKSAQAVVSLTGGTPIASLASTATFRSPSVVVPATTAHIYIFVTVRGTSGAATFGRVEARKAASL